MSCSFNMSVRYYLRRRLASEDIVTLGVTLSRCVCVCVRCISLGGEGNALYQCSVFCMTCLEFQNCCLNVCIISVYKYVGF